MVRDVEQYPAELLINATLQEAAISCAMIGEDHAFLQSALGNVAKWVEGNWSDGDVIKQRIEII